MRREAFDDPAPMPSDGSAGEPEVSVVLIFFNEERFLEEAIDSVFAQTRRDWELLLVDDGSTDASGGIARRVAEGWPGRVRYLEHPGHSNLGRSAARNLGLQHARGRFVAFLDGDDVWLPRKLERQTALMDSRPEVGMIYGSTELWHDWTGDPLDAGRNLVPDLGVALDVPLEGPVYLARMLERQSRSPCTCSMLLRRETARSVGGFEAMFRGMYDDQAFVAKVCLSAPVLASGECWDRYRQRPDSCYAVAKATGEDRSARRFFLGWLKTYLTTRAIADPLLASSLRKETNALPREKAAATVSGLRGLARRIVPSSVRRAARSVLRRGTAVPPPGRVDFGDLRRLSPIGRRWGKDRGTLPIDRYYIERFLAGHRADIRGRVLEVGDDTYTRRFGSDAVVQRDVLHAVPGNPNATIVADLARAGDRLPAASFDCAILTQVLHVIGDPAAAVAAVHRALRPGGVVLATFAGLSQVSRWDMERWGDYWRFTTLSARRLFESTFPPELVSVVPYGNVLTAIAFLHGLAAEELRPEELDYDDSDFQVLVAVRALRPETIATEASPAGGRAGTGKTD